MKQPFERKTKTILVTISHKGKVYWAFINALKVGDKYRISMDAYNHLLKSLKIPGGSTITIG